ncbi:WD40 repeat domain-containing protein [Archangium violaceum]|uniref:WD40 repeat domain-containing protein n=1 Tax=Archangium violaceum TaxID=83451 RepID=UPI002B2CA1C1|nr:WD40 repeat domain-containing protein [Archangium gephyra]
MATWDAATRRFGAARKLSNTQATELAVSPDGKWLAAALPRDGVGLFELPDLKPFTFFKRTSVRGVAFGPGNALWVGSVSGGSGNYKSYLERLNLGDGTSRLVHESNDDWGKLRFSPNNVYLAVYGTGGTLLQAGSGAELGVLPEVRLNPVDLAFSRDSTRLLYTGNQTRWIQVATRQIDRTIGFYASVDQDPLGEVWALGGPGSLGNLLITRPDGSTFKWFKTRPGEAADQQPDVTFARFSADAQYLVLVTNPYGGNSREVFVYPRAELLTP